MALGGITVRKALSNGLIVLGIAIIIFPVIGNLYNDYKQKQMMEQFEEMLVEAFNDTNSDLERLQQLELDDELEDIYAQMAESRVADEDELLELNSNNNKPIDIGSVIGIINIPKIEVNLPIISGTSENELSRGIGHMNGTPLPGQIGNSALAGHRSHTFSRFFNRLEEIDLKDEIYIRTKEGTKTYEVYEIKIVKPTDLSVLKPVEGESTITLITCHPLYSNKQRLIVHGKLIS